MKTLVPVLILGHMCAALFTRAQDVPLTGATPADFVKPGYSLGPGGVTTGDLNGDGRPDAVLLLAPPSPTHASDPRPLLVLLGQVGGGYRLALTAPKAILCATCGGVLGDPFEKLTITRGVLGIIHRGGSRERWRSVVKFRYQRGDFYQIGDTYDVTDSYGQPCPRLGGSYRTGSEHRDVNLVTGSFERVSVSADCQLSENSRGKQPVKPLVRLLDYQPQP